MSVQKKQEIHTKYAPQAIGPYSQAIRQGNIVYLSGQIGLIPETMTLVTSDIAAQIKQIFENLCAIAKAAGGSLNNIVKLTIFLTDFKDFPLVNEIMTEYFSKPYPARSTVAVAALPKNAAIEIEAIMVL